MNDKELIIDNINKKRDYCIDFLKELVRFDSQVIDQGVYGKEQKAQEHIKKKFQSMDADKIDLFEPDNGSLKKYNYDFNAGHKYKNRPNVVGKFDFESPGRSVILNGHIDTVPPAGSIESWKFNPWDPQIEKGRIYGLGVSDMKGGLAATILATEFLKELNVIKKGSIIIESVVDEEGGGNGTLACVDKGYLGDIALIAEPTNLEVLVAHRGVQLLEIKVNGLSVHAAIKWKGVNAIEKAVKIINGLGELEKIWLATKKSKYVPNPTITIGFISGGIGATIVPDSCVMRFDIKMIPEDLDEDMGPSKIRKEVEDWIYRICEGDEWLSKNKPTLNWYCGVSPYENKDISKFKAFITNTEKVLGKCKITGLPSGTDARLIGNFGKIPTIIFGPGVLGSDSKEFTGPHSVNESLDIEQYINFIKILSLSLYDYLNE